MFVGTLLLPACSSVHTSNHYAFCQDGSPDQEFDVSTIPNAVPKAEAICRYGNPDKYTVAGKRYCVLKNAKGYDKVGYASWYGTKFHGKLTSSKEPYDMYSMTAASTTLPIPTYVKVTNLENGRHVIVKVNDRGPFAPNRIIDLSYAAAKKLGYSDKGTARVRVTAIDTSICSTTPQFAENQESIYLQIGAFKNRASAERLSTLIAEVTKLNVEVKSSYKNNAPIYRVHIGPIDQNKYAQVCDKLAKYGFNKPIVVTG